MREEAQSVTFAALVKKLESYSTFGEKVPMQFSDKEIRSRLQKMIEIPGSDHDTPAAAVAKSNIPRTELVKLLMQVRSSALHRLNNHAIDEVRQTNLMADSSLKCNRVMMRV